MIDHCKMCDRPGAGEASDLLSGLAVLYVEGDPELREPMARLLRRRVGRLRVADSGPEGLASFRQSRPDLVITALTLPAMDGLVMAEAMRAEGGTAPVIVASAFAAPDELQRCIAAGVDGYVLEPVDDAQLLAVLRKCARLVHLDRARRESEDRYRMLFQHLHIGVCVIALEGGDGKAFPSRGRIVDCNDAFLAISGHASVEELGRQPCSLLVPEEQRRIMEAAVHEDFLPRGFMHEYERQFVRPDGSTVPAVVQSILRRDDRHRPCELWQLVTDLSEHKRLLQHQHLALKAFEGAGEAILITDGACRIVSVNQAFARVTGYAGDEVVGRNPSLLSAGIQSPQFYADMWSDLRSNGYWQGEIWNRRKNGEIYPEWLSITALTDLDGVVSHYIGIFSDITERKRAEERIRFLAQHDALTGLPNRVLLRDRLEHALACADRERRQLAVLFLDLDNFKTINDTLGHHVGDQVLQQVAVRLEGQLRAADTVCRQGGDEFIVILNAISCESDAALVAEKLKQALARNFKIGDQALEVGVSIGIALYPEDGKDGETLIRNADTAMYFAKQSGRNNFQFFTDRMNETAAERLALESALRHSIAGGELEIHFQPQIDLVSGRLCGAEALLRWRHPSLGLLSPERFLPLAEDSGLIVPIGEWVLEEVCRLARHWRQESFKVVPLAVNLSAVQFRHRNSLERLGQIIRDAELPPDSIELELTESFLADDVESASRLMKSLSDLGVSLALDDFGTGYSNLAYLKRYSIDKLKIDRSFVREVPGTQDSEAIVGAMIDLAKSLGMKVVAEGVEEPVQAGFLMDQGCDHGQGYHFARPMPAAEFAKWLQ